jgi:undecaprenyl diphosphate synthase
MDGNGRWATARGKPRTFGHEEGLRAARRIVEAASKLGVKYLTLYVFSTENWKRAKSEVDFIMGLVKQYLLKEFEFYKANSISIRPAGDITGLGADIAAELREAMDETKGFTGMQVILALNYGGRDEIVRAVRRVLSQVRSEKEEVRSLLSVDEGLLTGNMDNPDVPDPDLIIRTGGEERTSNFLLWEGAYSEVYFSPTLWPDFSAGDLQSALEDFAGRSRRFGSA